MAIPGLFACLVLATGCTLLHRPSRPGPAPVPGGEGMPALEVYPKQSALYRDLRQHTFSEIGADVDPVLTPDGAWLVYASNTHGPAYKLYRKTPEGRSVTRLTGMPEETSDRFPAINPKHPNIVAFASDRRGNYDIFIGAMDPVTEGPWKGREGLDQAMPITHGTTDEIHPTWSPDGDRLAWCAFDPGTGTWQLWVYDCHDRQTTCLGEGFLPSWSPDGTRIAFQKARGRGEPWYAIWTIDVSGNLLTQIVESTHWAAITPTWSPDGKTILFAAVNKAGLEAPDRADRADDLYVVRADGSALLRLTSHPAGEWSPAWGPDGRIYFCSDHNGAVNLWSIRPGPLVTAEPSAK